MRTRSLVSRVASLKLHRDVHMFKPPCTLKVNLRPFRSVYKLFINNTRSAIKLTIFILPFILLFLGLGLPHTQITLFICYSCIRLFKYYIVVSAICHLPFHAVTFRVSRGPPSHKSNPPVSYRTKKHSSKSVSFISS